MKPYTVLSRLLGDLAYYKPVRPGEEATCGNQVETCKKKNKEQGKTESSFVLLRAEFWCKFSAEQQ